MLTDVTKIGKLGPPKSDTKTSRNQQVEKIRERVLQTKAVVLPWVLGYRIERKKRTVHKCSALQ